MDLIEIVKQGASQRVYFSLRREGHNSVHEVAKLTPKQLLDIRNFGRKSLSELQRALSRISRGLPQKNPNLFAPIPELSDKVMMQKDVPPEDFVIVDSYGVGGCEAAVSKWYGLRYAGKWRPCGHEPLNKTGLCFAHGGADRDEYRKQRIPLNNVSPIKQPLSLEKFY